MEARVLEFLIVPGVSASLNVLVWRLSSGHEVLMPQFSFGDEIEELARSEQFARFVQFDKLQEPFDRLPRRRRRR